MKKNESIKNIMSSNLVFTNSTSKISEVKNLMNKHGIHHVPILSGKKLIGLVSRTDILRSSFSDIFVKNDKGSDDQLDSMASIEDIMTKDIKTLKSSSSVRDAALLLLGANYNSIPIIDDSEELVGVVTTKDIVRYVVEQSS